MDLSTTDILFICTAILNIIGLIGVIIPVLPGLPFSFVALVLCCFAYPNPVIITLTVLTSLFIVLITVLDYLAPGWITKKFGGCEKASIGATVGLIIGLFYAPWGLLIGPFLGAFIGEFWNKRKWRQSLKVALYSLLSLVLSTLFNFLTCIAVFMMCVGNAVWYYFYS